VRAWELIDEAGARETSKKLETGKRLGGDRTYPHLRGLVVGVKDVIDVAGMPTKSGSKARDAAAAAGADATVVGRLRSAGAIILGKTKTTEFAYTDPTDTTNPANPEHTPGGSSSGSAAAVAAGMADIALGTQTVGSVCRPAAYCGVAAFKPTTGMTPGFGVTPLARSFDTVGFFARRMCLAADAFACSVGIQMDGTTPTPGWNSSRVGVLSDAFYLDCDSSVADALDQTRRLIEHKGARVVDVASNVDFQAMREHHRTMMFCEAASVHGKLLDNPELLGANWCTALEKGLRISGAAYWAARDRLSHAKARLAEACAGVDILLLPPARSPAPKGLQSTGDAGFILPWTVFGGPMAVLPVGRAPNGLPTSVMITGKPASDIATARLAINLEADLANQTQRADNQESRQ